MIRLAFLDLRYHAASWVGAFAVAVACGYIGGWAASLQASAAANGQLQDASPLVIVFSLLAALAVLASTASLCMRAQQRSYALWQLAGMRPVLVGAVALVQLGLVGLLGAVCGTIIEAASVTPLFSWVFSAREEFARAAPSVGAASMPAVWLVVAGVFLLGGLKGARIAARTSPLAAMRELGQARQKTTVLRVVLFAVLAACLCWVLATMLASSPDVVMNYSPYLPLAVVAMLVPLAPLVFAVLLRAWTALLPQKRCMAWYLARHGARFGLASSSSVETPVMVGFGLVAGLYSVVGLWGDYAARQGSTGFTGIDSTTALLLLGGPVLLSAIGAAVSVVMTSRSRSHDVALLLASGASPQTLAAAAVCEAFIHVLTAVLVGVLAVLASNALLAAAVGMPLLGGLAFGEGLVVALVGFVLVLSATLFPTWAALGREAASTLAGPE